MTATNPGGGAAIPVSIDTTRTVQGGAAIPVYGYASAPTDGRPAMAGAAIPVRVLTAADLKQNGGTWMLEGRPYALPVYTAPATATVAGGPALAVYPINAWPPVPEPPTPPPTLPEVASATLLLNLQADALGVGDGNPVGTWTDASGQAHHFTSSGTARPTYRANGGNPYVEFDGVDDWMDGGDFADSLANFAALGVIYGAAATGIHQIVNKYDMDASWNAYGWEFIINFSPWGWIPSAYMDNNPDQLSASMDFVLQPRVPPLIASFDKIGNTQLSVRVNNELGAPVMAGSITTFPTTEHVLIGKEGGVNGIDDIGYSNIKLQAVMLYQITDTVNWTTDRTAIVNWLKAKYGIV